jgi:hypothetical protein
MRQSVKITNAALDETPDGKIILRGIIDPTSYDQLQTGPYQREILPLAKIVQLVKALKTGRVPDVELGLRGGNFQERDGNFYLSDDVFIIDGLQRITSGRQLLREGGDIKPHIGATIHFNTTEAWERDRFRILNLDRTRLSPNVLLRNLKEENEALSVLYQLTMHERAFLMCGKVLWDQRMRREHLIGALGFLRVLGILHSHLGPTRSSEHNELAKGLNTVMKTIGRTNLRENVKAYWDILDQCWGIRTIAYKEGAAYLKAGFLWCLAELLSGHENFWRGNRLFVEAKTMRKIKLFPLTDPHVKELAGAGGQARNILLTMMVDHINSGRREGRLKARAKAYESPLVDEVREGQSEEESVLSAAAGT